MNGQAAISDCNFAQLWEATWRLAYYRCSLGLFHQQGQPQNVSGAFRTWWEVSVSKKGLTTVLA